jgi:hypothetical protein
MLLLLLFSRVLHTSQIPRGFVDFLPPRHSKAQSQGHPQTICATECIGLRPFFRGRDLYPTPRPVVRSLNKVHATLQNLSAYGDCTNIVTGSAGTK